MTAKGKYLNFPIEAADHRKLKLLCLHRDCTLKSILQEEESGLTTAQYITNLLLEYYEMKENGGNSTMATNTRTMAFQVPEELFQRIKAHLERETQRTGRKLTQREFVLGLVEAALDEAERQAAEGSAEPEGRPSEGAGVGPCEAGLEDGNPQPQKEDIPAV